MFLSTLFLSNMNHMFLEKQLVAEMKMKVSCQIAGGVGNGLQCKIADERKFKRDKRGRRKKERKV